VRRGQKAGGSSVVVHLLAEREDHPFPRVGFVVSKAVGPAVDRNRVKRRLRHVMLDRVDRLPKGSDVVIRALPHAVGRTSEQLASDVDRALAEVGVL